MCDQSRARPISVHRRAAGLAQCRRLGSPTSVAPPRRSSDDEDHDAGRAIRGWRLSHSRTVWYPVQYQLPCRGSKHFDSSEEALRVREGDNANPFYGNLPEPKDKKGGTDRRR